MRARGAKVSVDEVLTKAKAFGIEKGHPQYEAVMEAGKVLHDAMRGLRNFAYDQLLTEGTVRR